MKHFSKSKTYTQTVEDEFGNLIEVKRRKYHPKTFRRINHETQTQTQTPPKRPAKEYALFLMGRREYSQQELRQKMKNKGYEDTSIEETLNWLQEKGFQSDERFAQSLIRNQQNRYGNRRIQQNLHQKGIDSDLIQKTLTISDDETERAFLAISKFKKYDLKDPKTKEKAIRFLAQRGFSYDLISKAWKHLNQNNDEIEDY